MAPPTARFQFAFDDVTLEPDPTWNDMDDSVRISGYTIDRGRAFELDRVDTGRATINLYDTEGIFDATTGLFIEPLKQVRLALWNPVLEDWYTRFRGFVEAYEIEYDPTQRFNTVTIRCVDIFEIVQAVQMFPGYFGHPSPDPNVVFFEDTADGDVHGMKIRVEAILTGDGSTLGDVGLDPAWFDVFSGNVALHETRYSPGESAMAAIQEAVDAEFPGVGNIYGDRLGRLAVHGRFARFDPVGTSNATDWDFHDWKAGDGAAVAASPLDTAHVRTFAMSRDLAKIINHAMASPVTNDEAPDFEGQVVEDTTSKGLYGIRAWESQNLITKEGVTDGNIDDWAETRRFAEYYVDNYADPENRITQISFRPMAVDATGAAANWALMSEVDLSDRVEVTVASPGGVGGGFDGVLHFVEGIHEEYRPMTGEMDEVTLSLDLSPADYFQDSPFST